MNLLAIPAPPFDSIGPVKMYGITMATGLAVAVFIAHNRYSKRHNGDQAILDIFLPVVIAGIVGARVYHLFTGYDWDSGGISGIFKLRNGGLSIWGAVLFGAIAVFVMSKIKNISFVELGAAIVPGLFVAQAIGRLGNYFNQELFGRPLDAPWALEVDFLYRPFEYEMASTFHPTFLYEAIWCLAMAAILVKFLESKPYWSDEATIGFYVFAYCLGRIYFEWLRIDAATEVFSLRFNLVLSVVLCSVAAIWLGRIIYRGQKLREKQITQ